MDFNKDKNTRLLNKSPTDICSDEPARFTLEKPPTNGEVYLQFRVYYRLMKTETNNNLKSIAACSKVYDDIKFWWKRTHIKILAKAEIIKQIQKLHETWRYLSTCQNNMNLLTEKKKELKPKDLEETI